MPILQLALPVPLRRLFDYLPPAAEPGQNFTPGLRFQVNFGNRDMIGVLVGVSEQSSIAPDKLKPALHCLDREPCFSQSDLDFYSWAASYYQHPIGEVLMNAVPSLFKSKPPTHTPNLCWCIVGDIDPDEALVSLKRAPKQRQLFELLREAPGLSSSAIRERGYDSTLLNQLRRKGLAEICDQDSETGAAGAVRADAHTPELNDEQQDALAKLSSSEGYQAFLLAGITGSGKTEIYLQSIAHTLQQQRQALVLVPEIGLTPQTLARFEDRFAVPIAVLHSGLSDGERLQHWNSARMGKAKIVIGTRSAIFASLPHLGIVIVDEEHDTSFKQQDGFRYSARDLALVRGQREGIPVVLGSATPSIDSLHNASRGRYELIKLTRRAGGAEPPAFSVVDIRATELKEGFASRSLEAIRERLDAGQQVLVFINRRGFAPILLCHHCGWNAHCHHCDARMTVHRKPPHLHCHHCDHRARIPQACPACQSRQLEHIGVGTERSELFLQETFADFPVFRVDRDSTQRKHALRDILDTVNSGTPCILVGTQMLAKGHHFDKLGLVVILDADGGLFSADFRGPERLGQTLLQVAGRAGRRRGQRGEVIIQSHQPDNPLLVTLLQSGYFHFAKALLDERRLAGLPPLAPMAVVRADSTESDQPEHWLNSARRILRDLGIHNLKIIGPLPSPMPKRAGRYRAQMLLQAATRSRLHSATRAMCEQLDRIRAPSQLRWSIDIDPVDIY